VDKAKEDKVKEVNLDQKDILKHLNMFYTKFINYREEENDIIPVLPSLNPIDYFVSYLFGRYENKELVLRKLKDIVSSTFSYTDIRIQQFAKLIRLTNESTFPEEIFIYAKLLKVSQVPLDAIFENKHDVFIKYEDACHMLKR